MNNACNGSCPDCPFACHADHENDQYPLFVYPAAGVPEDVSRSVGNSKEP